MLKSLVVAALVAQREHVSEAFGRDESRPGALALNDPAGCQGRAVDDQSNVGWLDAGRGEYAPHAAHHALFRRAGRGQHLGRDETARMFENDIGKGAADIDGQGASVRSYAHRPSRPQGARHVALSLKIEHRPHARSAKGEKQVRGV